MSSNISKFKKNKRTKTIAHRISSLSSCGVENEIDEDCCTNRDFDAFERVLSSLPSSSDPSSSNRDHNIDTCDNKLNLMNFKGAVAALCASMCLSTEVFLLSSSVIFPPEASALLSNPNSGLPRTPTAALRRATPRVNME